MDGKNISDIMMAESGIRISDYAIKTLILSIMICIDALAIFSNMSVILVIILSSSLRYCLSNFFIINLCALNFLAAVFVLPISISVFAEGSWYFGKNICICSGFLNTMLLFATILNVCTISIERFYAMKLPMHHAANLTVKKALLTILLIVSYSTFLATLPLYGWNSYEFRPQKGHCSFAWKTDDNDKMFVILTGILCFVIPSLIIILMYIGIFNIARFAATQVHPTVRTIANSTPSLMQTNITYTSPQNIPAINVNGMVTIVEGNRSSNNQSSRLNQKDPVFKAVKTLLFIVLMYFMLWGPYFFLYMAATCAGRISNEFFWEYFTSWLAYSSYAVNPFVYGYMNKKIREESVMFYKRKFCMTVRDTDAEMTNSILNILDNIERSNDARSRDANISPVLHSDVTNDNLKPCQEMDLESVDAF